MPFPVCIQLPTDLAARAQKAKMLFCLELFSKKPIPFTFDAAKGSMSLTLMRDDVQHIITEQQRVLKDVTYDDVPHIPGDLLCTIHEIFDGNTIFVWITDDGTAAMTLEVVGLRLCAKPGGVTWNRMRETSDHIPHLLDAQVLEEQVAATLKKAGRQDVVVTNVNNKIVTELDVLKVNNAYFSASMNSHELKVLLSPLSARFGISSKVKTKNAENRAKLINYEPFCFFIFTECRSLPVIVRMLQGRLLRFRLHCPRSCGGAYDSGAKPETVTHNLDRYTCYGTVSGANGAARGRISRDLCITWRRCAAT